MRIVIDIFDDGVDNYDDAVDMAKAIRKGTPLDKLSRKQRDEEPSSVKIDLDEESDFSVKAHTKVASVTVPDSELWGPIIWEPKNLYKDTNVAGVTVPDSELWSSSKEPHISLPNVCPICKFELRKPNLEPCKSCKMYSNWAPKEE